MDFYPQGAKGIEKLKAIRGSYETPELIDDGQHTAPSKRIIECFPDYKGAKPTVGLQIAQCIGVQKIREKCPHFNSWLSRLEQLA